MPEPEWVSKAVVLALHEEQLAEHGGSPGLRDEGLLESALGKPQNLLSYGQPDLADLAAAYAVGLAKNHAFVDGNKRVSNVVTLTFLLLNGSDLKAEDTEQVRVWLAIADGTMSEEHAANWIRKHVV
jgi:death-on-curing protein